MILVILQGLFCAFEKEQKVVFLDVKELPVFFLLGKSTSSTKMHECILMIEIRTHPLTNAGSVHQNVFFYDLFMYLFMNYNSRFVNTIYYWIYKTILIDYFLLNSLKGREKCTICGCLLQCLFICCHIELNRKDHFLCVGLY